MNRALIVGGYGEVGRRIAKHLLSVSDTEVILAGRNREKAETLARELGPQASALTLDVGDLEAVRRALESKPIIINCVDLADLRLIAESIELGLTLIDTSASYHYWQRVLQLKKEAERCGARILLGAGLIPGVTNVMAKAAYNALGTLTSLKTSTLLSLADDYGAAASAYTLGEAGQAYLFPGQTQPERSLVANTVTDFGGSVGRIRAYRFPFPGQFFYGDTLNTVASSWLALEPAWVGRLLNATVHFGGDVLLRSPQASALTHHLTPYLSRLSAVQPRFVVGVEAEGQSGSRRYRLEGQNQSDATALSLVTMLEQLDKTTVGPGIWLPEQWLEPERFFRELARRGFVVSVEEFIP